MNYMLEIKLFYDWLETHELSAMGISLWHALMQVASRSGWQETLQISLSTLIGRSSLSRTSIYKERDVLKKYGLIDYVVPGGRSAGIYTIKSFESRVVSVTRTQTRQHMGGNNTLASSIVSAARTQDRAQSGNIYRFDYTNNKKENKIKVVGMPAPRSKNISPKKEKSCGKKESKTSHLFDQNIWLAQIDAPWREAMAVWLEYKRTRRESYRSEMGAKKCLGLLRSLSDDDPSTAMVIIDQSIANNWAGLFPLRTGSHPGQILRPAGEERTRSLLDKFGRREKVGQ